MAQCSLQSQQPLVCDSFKNYESLSRVCFMDGSGCVMKLHSVEDVFVKIKLVLWMDGSGCVTKLNSVEDVFVKIKCMLDQRDR